MSDLIRRADAIEALDQIFDRCEEIEAHLPEGDPDRTGYKMYPDYMTVWKYLHQLPSAQPEIIYCKDCKHRYVDGENVRFNVCELNHNKVQSDDWFCADAERKEGEADD